MTTKTLLCAYPREGSKSELAESSLRKTTQSAAKLLERSCGNARETLRIDRVRTYALGARRHPSGRIKQLLTLSMDPLA